MPRTLRRKASVPFPPNSFSCRYYSDDCGITWNCYNGDQIWSPRFYAPLLRVPGILPVDPVIMAGGLINGGFSVGQFMSYDMGIQWQRPQCYSIYECSWPLTVPDCQNQCACMNTSNYYQHCYVLPNAPACSGALGADWDRYWLFIEDVRPPLGEVYSLSDAGTTGTYCGERSRQDVARPLDRPM